jgi:dolichyl-phosphate-mannose-protein mannosyltransferase
VPLAGLIILALVVRLWKIGQPSSVVFDEVHFGGFASKYINRKFFMDVHPPLAKLLIAGTAHLFNFDGKFDFKDIASEFLIGDHQPVPYVAMRLLPAFLGVALIPLCYLTLRALSMRGTTATVGSVLLLFDNAMATQSRLILLDSFLVFFTASTVFCWIEFCNTERRRAFTLNWWAWLASTGFFLGCVVSTKWVGLFTIASIGVATISQLWNHLGNIHLPMSILWKHFIARGACLIGIPMVVYLATFAVHLGVLNHSGDGDAFMSSAFQHTLVGHGMPDTFADVALGSTITLRHLNTQGGLLHSHSHNYPAGSGQQQITLYPHIDENNEWLVLAAPGPDDPPTPVDEKGVPLTTDGPHEVEKYKSKKVQALLDGMEIRLVHRKTDKRLHSHEPHRPPVTESDFQNEVTAYGFPGFAGDANDNWKVEIEYATGGDSQASDRVRSLRTIFRLKHTLTGCYLFSHKIALPDWGFGQQEVTCNKSPTKPNSLWYVETSTHPRLSMHGDKSLSVDEEGETDEYAANPAQTINYIRPTFLHRFWELQKVMWETNAGLTERHSYDSRPSTWPTMKRGINFWSKDHRQVYLIGNPIVWWGSTVAVLVYVGTRALLMLRAKRGAQDYLDSTIVFYDRTASFLFISYSLHFFPFFLMSRQLFIHHYLPALYFAVLLLALLFDLLTAGLRPRFRLAAATALLLVVVWGYSEFSALTYAGEWTSRSCERARWLKTWDFNCRDVSTGDCRVESIHLDRTLLTNFSSLCSSPLQYQSTLPSHLVSRRSPSPLPWERSRPLLLPDWTLALPNPWATHSKRCPKSPPSRLWAGKQLPLLNPLPRPLLPPWKRPTLKRQLMESLLTPTQLLRPRQTTPLRRCWLRFRPSSSLEMDRWSTMILLLLLGRREERHSILSPLRVWTRIMSRRWSLVGRLFWRSPERGREG